MKTLNIEKDFSPTVGLRYSNQSEKSGEEFYHLLLNKFFHECVKSDEKLQVILDGVDDCMSYLNHQQLDSLENYQIRDIIRVRPELKKIFHIQY